MSQHRRLLAAAAVVLAVAAPACSGDDGGASGLTGTWIASSAAPGTEFVFEDSVGGQTNLVALGATVGLQILNDSTFTLTVVLGSAVVDSRAGTWTADTSTSTITITEVPGGAVIPFDFTLAGNQLSIATQNFGDITFDFDGMGGADPAHLFGTFRRN